MSKKLTPLQAYEKIKNQELTISRYTIGNLFQTVEELKECDAIIETALKKGERLESMYGNLEKTLVKVNNEKEKYKKALKIIKNKRVDVDLFLTIMEDKNQDDKLWSYNFWNIEKTLTKEECELLQEVLK